MLSSLLRLGFPSDISLQLFRPTFYVKRFSMRPTCPAYLTVHDVITKIIYDKEYEL